MSADQAATVESLMKHARTFASGYSSRLHQPHPGGWTELECARYEHESSEALRAALTAALREQYEAGMERAAVICDKHDAELLKQSRPSFAAVRNCAAAIRAVAAEVKAS